MKQPTASTVNLEIKSLETESKVDNILEKVVALKANVG